MSEFDLITALALPGSALVDRRVPKSMLVENGASNSGRQETNSGRDR